MYPPETDHGLPLVYLKERRRELVVALQKRFGPVTDDELSKIAAIQQSITAFEEVIADLDCEQSTPTAVASGTWVHSLPAFGRRGLDRAGFSEH